MTLGMINNGTNVRDQRFETYINPQNFGIFLPFADDRVSCVQPCDSTPAPIALWPVGCEPSLAGIIRYNTRMMSSAIPV